MVWRNRRLIVPPANCPVDMRPAPDTWRRPFTYKVGKMPKGRTIQVQQQFVSSAARTADGVSNPLKCEHAEFVTFCFLVTAASGTSPGLGFSIQWSFDTTNWFTAHEIVRTGVTGVLHKTVPVVARYFRVTWEITGTSPSFTFKVDSAWRE